METVKKNEFVPEYRTPVVKTINVYVEGLICRSGETGSGNDFEWE